ncbi:MAG: hypothetical protein KHW65_06500, partial [Clostridiales bacterium]|nr:hypothetical protein [Clostridiales bacterium]
GQNRPAHIHQKNPAARTSSARYSRFVSFIVLSPLGRGRALEKSPLYIKTIIFRFLDMIFKSFFKNRKLCRIQQFEAAETVQKDVRKPEKPPAPFWCGRQHWEAPATTRDVTGRLPLMTNINRMAFLNTKRIRQPNGQTRGIPSAPHSV